MEKEIMPDAPMQIKNLADLKRHIRPGTELKAISHSNHPEVVGLVRVVTEVQSNAYYSKIKDQPEHRLSVCNHGKGFRSDFEKAAYYRFDGTTITVLDSRKKDGSVLYEMEIYPGQRFAETQSEEMSECAAGDEHTVKHEGMRMMF